MNGMGKILCSISTKGRYDTTLPLALQSIIMQTRLPDKLVIFDDNDPPKDMRDVHIYQQLFHMMNLKGLDWEWVYAERKGQHYNHDKANKMGYEWVWRMDDDTIAEPDTLDILFTYANASASFDRKVGAVGGSILTPPFIRGIVATGKIEDIDSEQNIQWDYIKEVRSVDHLHCSFLYRAGIHDYDLSLSKVAHREETLFTYGLKQRGYEILVVPAVTWHMKNNTGGIRTGAKEMFDHDEQIYRDTIKIKPDLSKTIVVLDCGMGDHIVFKHVLPEIKNPVVYSCYPDIVPGKSIAEARAILGPKMEDYNIYRRMDLWNWKGSLADAFRRLYVLK